VTFSGVGGTVLRNVAPGALAAGSMEAVNGGKLYEVQQSLGMLDNRVSSLETAGVDKPIEAPSPGLGSGTGTGSVVGGANADASGASSTALGQRAKAMHDNSVAIGSGSTTDRADSVSVGSAGSERQITNLAAGVAPTDAVNVQQMNNAVRSARQDAMGGVAAAMAVAGLPQSTLPGRTFVGLAGSTYGREYGSAIGVSYMALNGKWVVKASANTSSRGEVGAVVGGGFYW